MVVKTSSGLLRVLGTGFALSVALGNMVGSGIFRSPGALVGSTGSVWLAAVLIGAVAVQSLLSANLLAEVASAVALSGGSVVVIQRAFGETAALIIGWTDAFACVAGTAQAAAAAAGFLAILLPGLIGFPGLTGAALLILFGLLNWRGVVMGEVTQLTASATQGLLLLAILALLYFGHAPAVQAPSTLPPALVSIGGIVVGYQLVYGTFVGWNNGAYLAEETSNAGRSISRGMALAILAFAALYMAMLFGLVHALPLASLAGAPFPAQLALESQLGRIGGVILAIGAFFALLTCMNSGIMPGSRVVFALGRAGYAPRALARVNAGGTPDNALLLFMALSVALALTGQYQTIFTLMGTLALAVTFSLDAAFFQLRRREPGLARPFRAIGYPVLPVIALLLDLTILLIIAASDLWGTAYAAMLLLVGIVIGRFQAANRTRQASLVQR